MLALFRRFLATWPARVFFLLLIASFGLWGVADVVRNIGNEGSSVARVGDRTIDPAEFQEAFRRGLAQVTRMFGGNTEPTPAIRRAVAEQTLDRLMVQAALQDEAQRLGLAAPDAAVRDATFAIPAFRGPDGQFSRTQFNAALTANGLTEPRFLQLMRTDLLQQQLTGAVRAGAGVSETLADRLHAYQAETRVAEMVELPFAGAPTPPAPTADDLQRQYENHPEAYSAPEFRRIKAVILSPETLARSMDVTDDEVRAAWEQRKGEFATEERRSVEVVVAPDEAAANALASRWKAGASWADIQKAPGQGSSTVALDNAGRGEFPDPALAQAVFAAVPDVVTGPIRSALGFQVFRVTQATPATSRSFEDARTELRDRVARDKAADAIDARVTRLQDAFAGGATLDELPGDLGLAALTGTLDAKGDTPEGEPAPIPGSPALRQALLTAAFQQKKDDAPQLIEGPEQAYFALAIEDQTAARLKPFDTVEAAVREDWLRDQRRRAQEIVAAKLLAAVKGGQSLDDAATVADVRMTRTPPVGRNGAPPAGVPAQLVQPLFGLTPGQPTMVELPDAFVVAVPATISAPAPTADPAGMGQIRDALGRAMGDDLETVFAAAVRDRAKPTVNRALLDQLVGP